MKKFAFALAAGVLAIGATAQAAEVPSAEFAVITIPLATGNDVYNLIGVSVQPIVENANLDEVFTGLNGDAKVQKYTVDGYSSDTAPSSVPVSCGEAVWIHNAKTNVIYALGVAATESGTVGVDTVSGGGLVSSPFAAPWELSDTDLATGSSAKRALANSVSIWMPAASKYYKYIYRTGTGWVPYSSATPSLEEVPLPTIGAGQGVFVQFGSGRADQDTVTFTAPSAN